MKFSSLSITFLAALLASSLAMAEPKKFPDADTNGDGFVDATEFKASGVEGMTLQEADLDKDGKINKKEYEEALAGCD